MEPIDKATGKTVNGGPTLTEVYLMDEFTVRINVVRDTYSHQSRATSELLSAKNGWVFLLEEHPSHWFDAVRYETNPQELEPQAAMLLSRTLAVLGLNHEGV
jgi:hypothetical protein